MRPVLMVKGRRDAQPDASTARGEDTGGSWWPAFEPAWVRRLGYIAAASVTAAVGVWFGSLASVLPGTDQARDRPAVLHITDTTVVKGFQLTVERVDTARLEKGPPAWDASASSDTRGPIEKASYAFGQGFAQGLSGQSKDKDYDAWLSVVLTMGRLGSERPASPDLVVELTDDRGQRYPLFDRSYGWAPMRPSEAHRERMLFKVFSDARSFTLRIEDREYFFYAMRS